MNLRFLLMLPFAMSFIASPVSAGDTSSGSDIARDAGFKLDMGCLGYKTVIQRVDGKSPASSAGLRIGDEILSIYDRPIVGLRAKKILEVLNSSDAPLRLVVLRDDQVVEYTVNRYFVIPAWNEAGVLHRLEEARTKNSEQLIACLLNVGRFYDERTRTDKAAPFIVEAMELADKTWAEKDPRRVLILHRFLVNEFLSKKFRIERITSLDEPSKSKLGEYLKLTENAKEIPKRYANFPYELAWKVSHLNTRGFYDEQIALLERAVQIALKGTDEEPSEFDRMLGPRENIGEGYGNSEPVGSCCLVQYKLRDMLDYLAHVLYRSNRKPEAIKVAQTLYETSAKLRAQHLPNAYKDPAGLLFDFYREQNQPEAALKLAKREIDYLQSLPPESDEISKFETQASLSSYLLRPGILKERMHAYKDAVRFFEQSYDALKTIADKPGSNVEQGYAKTTERARRNALSSQARCEAALGHYKVAATLFEKAIDPTDNPLNSVPQLLDLALVHWLANDKSNSKIRTIQATDTLQQNIHRAAYMPGWRYLVRDAELLVALGEKERAEQLVKSLRDEFQNDKIAKRLSLRSQPELKKLTDLINDETLPPKQKDSQVSKKLPVDKPLTQCFLTLFECDGRE